ncbi:HTTM domain-containing protein [Christiangramia fulva]|uniref:HTTM domain-containing protein n=1 Tax=Christiangramia fulva TaxID=2126553 RepID=A0A2R3Z104_9FLAO|nr:HTTM domain-containing protein [Christiangramia fulva]AVR43947.1 HTTM domain-containing protein [Christiangramia fulva]
MSAKLNKYLKSYTEAAPLAVFRICFGVMMFISVVRFWLNGWIEKLYITPKFFFSYYGFEWVKPLGNYTYLIFAICGIAALLVAVGYKYRISILVFFLSFTYIELMDKTTYLNHYYFISILSFLMIFLPASAYFSLDAWKNRKNAFQKIPAWSIDAIKLLMATVYFYAGIAKVNSDWLLRAMPLKIWLPAQYDLPFLGNLMQQEWLHYAFSWSGMLYDLLIPFFLLWRRTRFVAFLVVIIFHVLTRILFPIGMFPYIMIVSALIFFSPGFHHRILNFISRLFHINKSVFDNGKKLVYNGIKRKAILAILAVFFIVQILFPWRYLLYPGELFWTEEGFRFSWRVMLMEKVGYAQFIVEDKDSGKRFYIDNGQYLTPFQEKQMSTQPDFILQYAHFLAEEFREKGHENIEVHVENFVALNGRRSRKYIDPEADLLEYEDSFRHKTFILPFNDEIKGI